MKTTLNESVRFAMVLATAIIAGTATSALAQTWTVTPIPTVGDFGWHVEVEVDSSRVVHGASYISGGSLWYGQYDDSSWSTQFPDLGTKFSLALDNSGRPHIAYSYYDLEAKKHRLALSRRSDIGTWETSDISTPSTESPVLMALDFDSQDRLHIAYKNTSAQTLRHVVRDGYLWNWETITSHSQFLYNNQDVNMVLDNNDSPHFVWSYFNTNDYNFYSMHTHNDGSGYQTTTIGSVLGYSMAFDSANHLHLSCQENNADLKHAVFDGSDWTLSSTIDTRAGTNSVAVDMFGRPHLLYLSQPSSAPNAIKHAVLDGTTWSTETIAEWTSTISGPEANAVAIDHLNRMHVIFADDNKDLYYATCDLGNEIALTPTVDFQGDSSNGISYTVTDGEYGIATQHLPSSGIYHRGVMEFDISAIPDGLCIDSATLELALSSYGSSSLSNPSLQIFGYAGDGLMGTDDPTHDTVLLGQSDPIDSFDPVIIELDPQFIESLLDGTSHLGLVAFDSVTGLGVGFWASEAASFRTPPTLTLTLSEAQPSIPGDTDGNGWVDEMDATVVAARWGLNVSNGAEDGDFNGDGVVNATDASILAANWNPNPVEGTNVPEPGLVVMLVGLGLALLRRRS